jgi:hypothetical protein
MFNSILKYASDLFPIVIALLGSLMSYRKLSEKHHTAMTIALVVAGCVGSFITVTYQNLSDRAHETEVRTARAEQQTSFATILVQQQKGFDTTIAGQQKGLDVTVKGLEKVIRDSDKHFNATMGRTGKIIEGVSDDMRMQTGGDSLAYITFTAEPGYVQFGNFSNPSGHPWFLVAITSHGKYPLRDVRATLMDDERRKAALEEYGKHPNNSVFKDFVQAIESTDTHYQWSYLRPQSPEAPSGDVETIGAYPIPEGNTKKLSIAFSAINGYWSEILHLGLVNGQWRQCLSVVGPTMKQAQNPFVYCEPEWPEGRALAEKDWPHAKPLQNNKNRRK